MTDSVADEIEGAIGNKPVFKVYGRDIHLSKGLKICTVPLKSLTGLRTKGEIAKKLGISDDEVEGLVLGVKAYVADSSRLREEGDGGEGGEGCFPLDAVVDSSSWADRLAGRILPIKVLPEIGLCDVKWAFEEGNAKPAFGGYVCKMPTIVVRDGGNVYCVNTVVRPDGERLLAVAELNNGKRRSFGARSLRFKTSTLDIHLPLTRGVAECPLHIEPAGWDELRLFNYMPSGSAQDISGRDLIDKLVGFFSKRHVPSKAVDSKIDGCNSLASWVREIFSTAPLRSCTGKNRTGKSTLLQLYHITAFLAMDMASATGPVIAELDDLYHPFLLLDNCQVLNEKRNPDTSEKLAVLDARYKWGSVRAKMGDQVDGKARRPKVQSLFGFGCIAGTELPSSISLRDRLLPQPAVKGQPEKPVDDTETFAEAEKLRAMALSFRLRYCFDFESVEELQRDLGDWDVDGRTKELALPVLWAARLHSQELFDELKKHFEETARAKAEKDTATEEAGLLWAYISVVEHYLEKDEGGDILLAEATEMLNDGRPEPEHRSSGWVSNRLHSLGFSTYRGAKGKVRVKFDGQLLVKQLSTYGVSEDLPIRLAKELASYNTRPTEEHPSPHSPPSPESEPPAGESAQPKIEGAKGGKELPGAPPAFKEDFVLTVLDHRYGVMKSPTEGYTVHCDCGENFYVDAKDEDELRERLKTHHEAFHSKVGLSPNLPESSHHISHLDSPIAGETEFPAQPPTTTKSAKMCGDCIHHIATRCLKHPEWVVIMGTAAYAQTCDDYTPKEGVGKRG